MLLFIGILTLAFNIQPVKASGTIYIRADGSIDPPTAPIQRVGSTYTLTDNIFVDYPNDGIVVERDNIIIDGAGYTIEGSKIGSGPEPWTYGIDLAHRNNVIIEDMKIKTFTFAIWLDFSSDNYIIKNTLMDTGDSIVLLESCLSNTISGNNIAGYVVLNGSSYNTISENIFEAPKTGIGTGIHLLVSSSNIICGNTIKNYYNGIGLHESSANIIYHNNFMGNEKQVYTDGATVNVWDDGYPSGGNYWSDYTDVDLNNDGIWDHPYVIDANNQDHYPLVNPWSPSTLRITGIDPSQPIAGSGKQLLGILGEGFVPNSEVTLFIGSDTFHIPRDRTLFINPNKIEISAGLTEGLWKAWVTNPGGIQSNEYAFQVRSVSMEDGKKVLALALQYWDVENAIIMTAIARAESGWIPSAAGDPRYSDFNCMGYASWGLCQIFMGVHIDKLMKLGAPTDDPYKTAKWLSDPSNNVRAAYEVWKEAKGFKPWTMFKNGEYKKYLADVIKLRASVFKCPVNVTITDNYGRIISETENQIPGASFVYFNATDTKIFYLPSDLTYQVQLNATDYGNCTIGQITPTESVYETAFSQAAFNLTSETVAQFDLLPYDANYTLKVDENGDGLIDYEIAPEMEILTTEYDIGITETAPLKTIIGQGYNLSINITVMNYGAHTETFNVTLHANETFIELQNITLASRNSTTITFTWNTSGFAKGNYTIKAVADTVLGEIDTLDNTYIYGIVLVTVSGDVTGEGICDMQDISILIDKFLKTPSNPQWDANCDINNDNVIDMADISIAIDHFLEDP
jgi:parallel beta-helix repeat protein